MVRYNDYKIYAWEVSIQQEPTSFTWNTVYSTDQRIGGLSLQETAEVG